MVESNEGSHSSIGKREKGKRTRTYSYIHTYAYNTEQRETIIGSVF